jgi:hypothetical protein
MYANKEEELKAVRLKTVKVQLLGIPGAILIGLALYAIFVANGNAFHPALNDKNTAYTMLAIGIVIEVWQFFTLIPLWKRQMQLRDK